MDESRHRVRIWGTFPRDPALVLVALLAVGFGWVLGASPGLRRDLPSLLFFGLLVAVPSFLVVVSGVWVKGSTITTHFGPIVNTFNVHDVERLSYERSAWTNGIHVLSFVLTTGKVVPIPGWWIRSERQDRAAVTLLSRAVEPHSLPPLTAGTPGVTL
jgi:hypothetical protein